MATAIHPGAGLDATSAIQTAITNSAGGTALIPYSANGDWIVSSPVSYTDSTQETDPAALTMLDNQTLILADGVVLKAAADSFHGKYQSLLGAVGKTSFGIQFGAGSRIEMRKADYQGGGYTAAEWRHCLKIVGCGNVAITGQNENHLMLSGGDGLYVGPTVDVSRTPCSNVAVTGMRSYANRRQGMSILSLVNGTFTNCQFDGSDGIAPKAGVDLEPVDMKDRMTNIVFENCSASGNTGPAFYVLLNINPFDNPVSVTFRNCRSVGTSVFEHRLTPANSGTVIYEGCQFRDANSSGLELNWDVASLMQVSFKSCTFYDTAIGSGKPITATLYKTTADGVRTGFIDFSKCRCYEPRFDRKIINVIPGAAPAATNITGKIFRDWGGHQSAVSQTDANAPNLVVADYSRSPSVLTRRTAIV